MRRSGEKCLHPEMDGIALSVEVILTGKWFLTH
jgi:hypothetical protein